MFKRFCSVLISSMLAAQLLVVPAIGAGPDSIDNSVQNSESGGSLDESETASSDAASPSSEEGDPSDASADHSGDNSGMEPEDQDGKENREDSGEETDEDAAEGNAAEEGDWTEDENAADDNAVNEDTADADAADNDAPVTKKFSIDRADLTADDDLLTDGESLDEPNPVITDGTQTGGADWGAEMMGLDLAKAKYAEDGMSGHGHVVVAVVDTGCSSDLGGRITGGESYLEGGNYLSDPSGHGTQVARVIANNTPDDVDIIMLQALDSDKRGTASAVAQAIKDAYSKYDADIINLSLSVSRNDLNGDEYDVYTDILENAVAGAVNHGCFVIASAGNDRSDIGEIGACPANIEGCITVNAIDSNKNLYEYSNYGSAVDFCGPGSIDGYTGTSIAAPYISAAYAYMFLYNPYSTNPTNHTSLLSIFTLQETRGSQFGKGLPHFTNGYVPHGGEDRPRFSVDASESYISISLVKNKYLNYDVYRRKKGESEFVKIGSTENGTYTDYDVEPRSSYEYYVKCTVNGYYKNDSSSDIVEASAKVLASSIKYAINKQILNVGESTTILAEVVPDNATDPTLIWSSEDPEIASVDDSGVVTGLKAGTTQITIKSGDGICSTSCSVTVFAANGQCGDNLYWNFDEESGTLTIYGEGEMIDAGTWPWETYAKQIRRIHVDDGVTEIGGHAFECLNLDEITGMRDVKKIKNYAFQASTIKGSFILPEEVDFSSTRYPAFENATIERMVIPASFNDSESNIFNLTTAHVIYYEVNEHNLYYSSVEGALYNKDQTTLICAPFNDSEEFVIPETVETIGDYAFYQCKFSEVTVPDGVKNIGAFAFGRSNNLRSISLPDTVNNIGSYAFYGCQSLREVKLPSGLSEIPGCAFSSTGLISCEIPNGVEVIGVSAFSSAGSLENVILPNTLKRIETHAFSYCKSLKEITLPASLQIMYKSAFNHCDSLEKVTYGLFTANLEDITSNLYGDSGTFDYPLFIDANGSIGDSGLTWHAEGPSGDLTLTISGTGAMPNFAKTADIPWADGKDEIRRIVIEEGVSNIGSNAFSRMANLESVELPMSIVNADNENAYGFGVFLYDYALERFIIHSADGTEELSVFPQYLEAVASGKAYEPQVIVATDPSDPNGTDIGDYAVGHENTTKEGAGRILISFSGDNAGLGEIALPFTVVSKSLAGVNIKRLSDIRLSSSYYAYTGGAVRPNPVVTSGKFTLKEGADYTLGYRPSDCTEPGSYAVTATGIGAYTGSVSESFTIGPKPVIPDPEPSDPTDGSQGGSEDDSQGGSEDGSQDGSEDGSQDGSEDDPRDGSSDGKDSGGDPTSGSENNSTDDSTSGKRGDKSAASESGRKTDGTSTQTNRNTSSRTSGSSQTSESSRLAESSQTSESSQTPESARNSGASTASDDSVTEDGGSDEEILVEEENAATAEHSENSSEGADSNEKGRRIMFGAAFIVLFGGPLFWFFLLGKKKDDDEEEEE